jgi:hypothetical protein
MPIAPLAPEAIAARTTVMPVHLNARESSKNLGFLAVLAFSACGLVLTAAIAMAMPIAPIDLGF